MCLKTMHRSSPTGYTVCSLRPALWRRLARAIIEMFQYLWAQIECRRERPGHELISLLMESRVDGEPLSENDLLGGLVILLLAGVDTTWGSIGSSLHHLAQHPEDRARLVAALGDPPNPTVLWFTACEEFLRAFSPVTIGRVATCDVEMRGQQIPEGDLMLVSYNAANRDPEVFDRPEEVLIDRTDNRHLAFGVGIAPSPTSGSLTKSKSYMEVARFVARTRCPCG